MVDSWSKELQQSKLEQTHMIMQYIEIMISYKIKEKGLEPFCNLLKTLQDTLLEEKVKVFFKKYAQKL